MFSILGFDIRTTIEPGLKTLGTGNKIQCTTVKSGP